jgi:hypothetical protein
MFKGNANRQARENILNKRRTAAITWQDISTSPRYKETAYNVENGGTILSVGIDVLEDMSFGDIEIVPGHHVITIESRYDYVDVWVDDEQQLWEEIKVGENQEAKKQEVNRLRQEVSGWLQELQETHLIK